MVVHDQNRGFRWRGWSKNDEGELRIKIQVVVWANPGRIDGDENGLSPSLSSFDCWWPFSATMTGVAQASDQYQT